MLHDNVTGQGAEDVQPFGTGVPLLTKWTRLSGVVLAMLINAKDPEMSCPGCRNRMSALDFEPILFTDGLVDVTYVCDWCGMQTKRAMASTAKRMAPARAEASR